MLKVLSLGAVVTGAVNDKRKIRLALIKELIFEKYRSNFFYHIDLIGFKFLRGVLHQYHVYLYQVYLLLLEIVFKVFSTFSFERVFLSNVIVKVLNKSFKVSNVVCICSVVKFISTSNTTCLNSFL